MNEQALKNAIKKLPQHTASKELWERIEEELELGNAIAQLPIYSPTEKVWQQIATQLPARRVQMKRRWLSIAAGFAVLLMATFLWQNQANKASVLVERNTEMENTALLAADWNTDEDAFEIVENLCKQHPFLCENITFQELQYELTELEEAKSLVLTSMQKYGEQARLIHQVKSIEQERSSVLKQMVKMI